jgi:hypothetical protein
MASGLPWSAWDGQARAAYRAAALAAIESCREVDGALHWRPEVAYAVATG